MKIFASVLAASTLIFGSANAAYFYLSDTSQNGSTVHTYSNSEVTMEVTAGLYDSSGITESPGGLAPTSYGSYGMGIKQNSSDNHMVDGAYGNEVLLLSFDMAVQITKLVFAFVDDGDKFDVFGNGESVDLLELIYDDVNIPGGSTYRTIDVLSLNLTGTLFGIGASGKYDDWKLKKVYYEKLPDVPLPAAAPLFVAGLAGFGLVRRKKRA